MKLFEPVRKVLPILVGFDVLSKYGITAPNVFQQNLCRFTSLFGYVILSSSVLLMGGFFAFEATNFLDYSDNFYAFETLLIDTFYFTSIQWLYKNIFELNECYEKLIDER